MQSHTFNKRLFFVAGERSGDMHGANLIRELRRLSPGVQCEGLGGRMMEDAGMALRHDLASQAIMGFSEVVKHFPAVRRLMGETITHLEADRPDGMVLIDYPGFNLHLAKRAKALGIPVIYYISPQVWAWKKKRIHTIARCVRKMLVILPFEEDFYRQAGVDCTYVGHPLLDHIDAGGRMSARAGISGQTPVLWTQVDGVDEVDEADQGTARGDARPPVPVAPEDDIVIGLLPGSRAQEIARLMPAMIDVARGIQEQYPQARFMTPCVDEARAAQVRSLAGGFPVEIAVDGMEQVLRCACFCLVASGTATLETALYGVPMLILYRVSPASYLLARMLVRDLEHIGIVNILAGKGIVPEFVQHEVSTDKILPAALELIGDTPARARMLQELAKVRVGLGAGGASKRAAEEILACLSAPRK